LILTQLSSLAMMSPHTPIENPRSGKTHTKLKMGQLNNYKSYEEKLIYKVIANDFLNILKVKWCL